MQVYATDRNGKKVFVARALPGHDYFCLECKGRMRSRHTMQRKMHFFHLAFQRHCRLAGKSIFHIATQNFVQKAIGDHECQQEVYFEEIRRVADLAWHAKKIVIEIQCSPISALEVEERTHDYESLGWAVIWIFHQKTFNHQKITEAERFVIGRTHYYTNIDEQQGSIYDQYQEFPIDISMISRREALWDQVAKSSRLPLSICQRLSKWQYSASGDLVWHALGGEKNDYFWKAFLRRCFQLEQKQQKGWLQVKRLYSSMFFGIRSIWYLILEKSCR